MQAANPVDQDPISKAWFQRQLQQYPAVRSRDYVGPQNLPRPPTPEAFIEDAPRAAGHQDYDKASTAQEFWTALKAFLEAHYSAEDAARIHKDFQKAHYAELNKYSLDDIEDLAKAWESRGKRDT